MKQMAALLYLVRFLIPTDQSTIIFTATRHHSEFIHALLTRIHVSSTVVYGSMDQDARSNNLRSELWTYNGSYSLSINI